MSKNETAKTVGTEDKFKVVWVDHGREPQCEPNPSFLEGRDIDVSKGAERACVLELPYPARRCGVYVVECRKCGLTVGFTTAGRPDDPRRVKFACKPLMH